MVRGDRAVREEAMTQTQVTVGMMRAFVAAYEEHARHLSYGHRALSRESGAALGEVVLSLWCTQACQSFGLEIDARLERLSKYAGVLDAATPEERDGMKGSWAELCRQLADLIVAKFTAADALESSTELADTLAAEAS